MINALGETTLQIFDGLQRLVATRDGNGFVSRRSYDSVAESLVGTTASDPLGHATRMLADALGHARVRMDAENQRSLTGFDASGNPVALRDPNGVGWNATVDARNRLRVRTDTAGAVTRMDHDAQNNLVRLVDALGHVTACTFDANDRKTTCVDRIAATTRYSYDLTGNLVQLTDAEGGVTDYAYDGRDLLITETFPTGQQGRTQRTYAYDPGRRLTSRTVRIAGAPAGAFQESTQYQYDHADRLLTRAYDDHLDDTFTYDAASRVLSAHAGRFGNAITRTYDAGGRLTSETMAISAGRVVGGVVVPFVTTVGRAYDAANRVLRITHQDGTQTTRGYTARDQLATVAHAGAAIANRLYDAGGRLLTTTLGNGLVERRTYQPGDSLPMDIGIPGVTGFSYTFDANKRMLQEVDAFAAMNTQGFLYDAEDRMTAWNRATAETQAFALTPVSDFRQVTRNGVVETRAHTPVHEVTALSAPTGVVSLTYDAKGDLTRDEHATALTWDPENRLIRARIQSGTVLSASGAIATYAYDALGRRVEKTVAGRTTRFVHDGAQVVQELTSRTVPAASDLAGDGSLANAAEAPASGGILPGADVTRIAMQPATSVVPTGYLGDRGRAFGPRNNGRSYGWEMDASADAVSRGSALPLTEFDSFLAMQPSVAVTHQWSIALPDGSYPVVVVCGDALSANQTNHLQIGDQTVTDATPAVATPGYQRGNFDGYAVQVTVTGGRLRIAPRAGAVNAKLCFLEIGARGATMDVATRDRLADLIDGMNAATWEAAPPATETRGYVYGTHVDEILALITATGVSFSHGNQVASIVALSDPSGSVIERYRYDAYGQRTILAPNGLTIRTESSYANAVGFTGRSLDVETGLWYFRSRYLSPALGRFIGRDPLHARENLLGQGLWTWFVVDGFVPTVGVPRQMAVADGPNLFGSDPIRDVGIEENLYVYAKCSPGSRVDPSGLDSALKIATVAGPTAGKCGAFIWTTQWSLAPASPRGGIIVQEIKVTRRATDCLGKEVAACNRDLHFWEAWEVSAGQTTTDASQRLGVYAKVPGKQFDDVFTEPPCGVCTVGNHTATGTAKFHEAMGIPAGFRRNNPKTPAGLLNSSPDDPKLQGGSAAANHSITTKWYCCGPFVDQNRDTEIVSHDP